MIKEIEEIYYLFRSSTTGEPLEMIRIRYPKWDKNKLQEFITEAREYADKELPDGDDFEKVKLAIDILKFGGGCGFVRVVDWANDDVLYF